MNEKEKAYWQKFLQTGEVSDYLRYREYTAEGAGASRRSMEKSAKTEKRY